MSPALDQVFSCGAEMTVQTLLLRARSALDKADDVHQQHDPLLFVWLGEDLLDLWQQAGGRGPLQTGGLGAWRVWEGGQGSF